jgi:hypothetical protein
MLKPFLLALCAGTVFMLIPQDRASTVSPHDSDSDEVYAAVVDWRTAHPGEGPKVKLLVFADTTEQYFCLGEKPGSCATKVRKELTGVFGRDIGIDVISDFLEQNKDRGALSRSIPTELPKSWLTDSEEAALFKSKDHDGWKSFYAKYPGAGGIMAFSRVGFNEKRDRALVYSTIGCGWLCGTGHYHLLKKEASKWVLIKNYMAWIS